MARGKTAEKTKKKGTAPRKTAGPVPPAAGSPPPAPSPSATEPAPATPVAPRASNGAITVRSAMPSDAPALRALWMELNRALAAKDKEWELAEGAAERLARGVQTAASNPRALYLLAELPHKGAARMAGFLHATVKLRSPVFRESVVGEISAIFVASDSSGKGVATALLGAAMDWFRQRGITTVETTVAPPQSPTREFFLAAGFRESAAVLVAGVPPAPAAAAVDGGASKENGS